MMASSFTLRRVALSAAFLVALAGAAATIACSNSASAPLGQVVLNPTSITFTCLSGTATFTASQTNYNGTFSAVSNNTADVTVAPASPPNTFVLTSQAGNGNSTTVTVTGGGNMTATLPVQLASCVCRRHHDMWAVGQSALK